MNKIIQVAATERTLIALTSTGELYVRQHAAGQWNPMSLPDGVETEGAAKQDDEIQQTLLRAAGKK